MRAYKYVIIIQFSVPVHFIIIIIITIIWPILGLNEHDLVSPYHFVPHVLKLHNQIFSNRVKASNVGRTDFHTPPTQAPTAVIFVTTEELFFVSLRETDFFVPCFQSCTTQWHYLLLKSGVWFEKNYKKYQFYSTEHQASELKPASLLCSDNVNAHQRGDRRCDKSWRGGVWHVGVGNGRRDN